MAVTLKDLQDKLAAVQAALTAEDSEITTAIAAGKAAATALKQQITDLKNAGTIAPADMQALADGLDTVVGHLNTTAAAVKDAAKNLGAPTGV